jgi:glycosyltransferase involved in cell wall biosynthesis
MAPDFDEDEHPNRPKILFVGLAQSSHTHAWIDLLGDSALNVRLFAIPGAVPPSDWRTKTYLYADEVEADSDTRRHWYSGLRGRTRRYYHKAARRLHRAVPDAQAWLADLVRTWRPDVIHTLGLFDGQGGLFYLAARRNHDLRRIGKWVLQLRGGSDIMLRRSDPETRTVIQEALGECDQIVCDNTANVEYMRELGVDLSKVASIVPVPGSGGIDLSGRSEAIRMPSQRERIVVWPKAYECPWSKALPVLEAIQMVWDTIKPCEFYFLAATPDVRDWYWTLPDEIRAHCHIADRIPRPDVFSLLGRARVMLAPSLVDGIPNSLYEAMACGAFPIVSPLETIRSLPIDESNAIFVRNMYPHEIAEGLCRALTDNALVDRAAARNRELVRQVADRAAIRPRVVEYYRTLAASQ